MSLGYEVVSQTVELNSTTAYSVFVDVDIPACKSVLGSGAVTTEILTSNGWTAVDDLTVESDKEHVNNVLHNSGPHPTDNTKWRFQLRETEDTSGIRVQIWIAVA